MAHIHIQPGMGHAPCYQPTKIGTVTGASGSMKTVTVDLINAVLYSAVFEIIGMSIVYTG